MKLVGCLILLQNIIVTVVVAKQKKQNKKNKKNKKKNLATPEYLKLYSSPSHFNASSNSQVFYDCLLTNHWTRNRHPVGFPFDAHWSSPVYATHNKDYIMFDEGALATQGLEDVAELGSFRQLEKELLAEKGKNVLFHTVAPAFLGGSLFLESLVRHVCFGPNHPLLSMVTMIAPSPDWFSGINNFDMRDGETNTWYSDVILDLFPWDAGTDKGGFYTSPNSDSNDPTFQLTINSIPSSGVFANPDDSTVLPVARIECKLDI